MFTDDYVQTLDGSLRANFWDSVDLRVYQNQ